MNTIIISKYEYFNQALSNLFQRRFHIKTDTLLIGFDQLDVSITTKHKLVFLLAHDIIESRVLDIGYVWGYALAPETRVCLFDFNAKPDYGSNPVILNPLKTEFDNLPFCSDQLPVRRAKKDGNTFMQTLQGLFRTHGHGGFLGELGKLQTFLIGGLEFFEDTPQDPFVWKDFFQPCRRFIRNLVTIFEAHRVYLNYWPDKETVRRLKKNMLIVKDWDNILGARLIKELGPKEEILDLLDMLEKDILSFKMQPDRFVAEQTDLEE